MTRFVSIEKRSKREQKAFHALSRRTWDGVNPVSRVVPSKKAYDRRRFKACID